MSLFSRHIPELPLHWKGRWRVAEIVIFALLLTALAVGIVQTYYMAEQKRLEELSFHYQDEAQFTVAQRECAAVEQKYNDYLAQGVNVSSTDGTLSEIKEDMNAGVYDRAIDKCQAMAAALEQLLAQKLAAPPTTSTTRTTTTTTSSPPAPAATACGSQYYTQTVAGFTTYIIEANLDSGCVRVITDTAYGGSNCADNCPVYSLSHYVSSNGAFAGLNGTYFCPADYAACSGEDGSFFWKVFNSNVRFMHNASNGLAHLDPYLAVAGNRLYYFPTYSEQVGGVCTSSTFCSQASFEAKYGSMQAGLGCGPALLYNGANVLNEGSLDDKQRTTKSNRGAVGVRGNVLYLVIAAGATVPDLAQVLDNLPIDHAFNVDGGGSSAMYWQGAYKRGPGRNIPNAIILKTQ